MSIDGLRSQFCVSSSVHTTNVLAQLQLGSHGGNSFVRGELVLSASFWRKIKKKETLVVSGTVRRGTNIWHEFIFVVEKKLFKKNRNIFYN